MTVLLADEPAGAVDTATGEEIGELLLDLKAAGQTLVLVTQSPDLAARYARRTVRLVDGRVAADTGLPAASRSAIAGSCGRRGQLGGTREGLAEAGMLNLGAACSTWALAVALWVWNWRAQPHGGVVAGAC
jgi:energy-coupling factor transporter ATP-binding protein EcfA2